MTEMTTENTTETKTTKGKAPKKTFKAKAATPKAKTPKTARPKRQRTPQEAGLMTFAFRLTKAESQALHAAAGPANSSRTMRALAAAFVAEDRAAFEAVVEGAKKLR